MMPRSKRYSVPNLIGKYQEAKLVGGWKTRPPGTVICMDCRRDTPAALVTNGSRKQLCPECAQAWESRVLGHIERVKREMIEDAKHH